MEHVEAFLTTNVPKLTPHFAATHMAWGAVNEMMAASAYTQLAYYSQNKELSKLLLRLAKDERRHQSFYYHQAERRLVHAMARRLADRMDRRMSELPGFSWFDRVERSVVKAIADFRRKEPARADQIRARKTEIAKQKTAKQKADFESSTVPIAATN
jgi:hypothetical protein